MADSDDEKKANPRDRGDGDPRKGRPKHETAEMRSVLTGTAQLFRSSEIFKGLTPEEVREIIHVSEEIELDPGEMLFEQGDPAQALYVVESGELEVRSNSPGGEDVVLAKLGPGSIVGEMSIIGGGKRSASVASLSNTALYRLSRESFESLRSQNRPAAYKIIVRLARTLGERRRTTDARVQEVFEDPQNHLDDFEQQVHEMLGQIRKA